MNAVTLPSRPKAASLSKSDKKSLKKFMKLGHNYYVYIVQCADGHYYTGMTNDLERRLAEHNEGIDPNCFTFTKRPVELKYYEHLYQVGDAIEGKTIKGLVKEKKRSAI